MDNIENALYRVNSLNTNFTKSLLYKRSPIIPGTCPTFVLCAVAFNLLFPYRLQINVDLYDRIKAGGDFTKEEKAILEKSQHEIQVLEAGATERNEFHKAQIDLINQRARMMKESTAIILLGNKTSNSSDQQVHKRISRPSIVNFPTSYIPYKLHDYYFKQRGHN